MMMPGTLRFALWAAEITDRFARWIARDTLGERLARAADEFDLIDVPQIDRGEFRGDYFTPEQFDMPIDELAARRRAKQRHPAGRAL